MKPELRVVEGGAAEPPAAPLPEASVPVMGQAVPVPLVKPNAPGLATWSRKVLLKSSTATLAPAVVVEAKRLASLVLKAFTQDWMTLLAAAACSAPACAVTPARTAENRGVRAMSGKFITSTFCAPLLTALTTMASANLSARFSM